MMKMDKESVKGKVADSYMGFAKRTFESRTVWSQISDFWKNSTLTYKVIILVRVAIFIGCIWGANRLSDTIGQFWLYLLGLVCLAGAAIYGVETLVLTFAFGSRTNFYMEFASVCGVKTYENPQPEEEYKYADEKNVEMEEISRTVPEEGDNEA